MLALLQCCRALAKLTLSPWTQPGVCPVIWQNTTRSIHHERIRSVRFVSNLHCSISQRIPLSSDTLGLLWPRRKGSNMYDMLRCLKKNWLMNVDPVLYFAYMMTFPLSINAASPLPELAPPSRYAISLPYPRRVSTIPCSSWPPGTLSLWGGAFQILSSRFLFRTSE